MLGANLKNFIVTTLMEIEEIIKVVNKNICLESTSLWFRKDNRKPTETLFWNSVVEKSTKEKLSGLSKLKIKIVLENVD